MNPLKKFSPSGVNRKLKGKYNMIANKIYFEPKLYYTSWFGLDWDKKIIGWDTSQTGLCSFQTSWDSIPTSVGPRGPTVQGPVDHGPKDLKVQFFFVLVQNK